MIVRAYEERDSDRLYEILSSSLDQSYKPEMFTYFHLQWPRGQLVVCDFSGRPIGFLCASKIDERHAKIMLFAVDKDYRSMGLGSKLLIALRQAAIMSGMDHISLEVRPSNMRAINFYKRHGFVATEILKQYYTDGDDAVSMHLIIN
ncbi:MAG: GNAT family N-acetyltransferase [Methanomassiliicoccaceae archaeon]|nr:GNAT family N-acetyltransferase [Methanomassiliicoccaceae archaeon]